MKARAKALEINELEKNQVQSPNYPQPQEPQRVCTISTTIRAWCDVCGVQPRELHLPEEYHGWYCPVHCPACNQNTRIPKYVPPADESQASENSEDWLSNN